MSNGPVVVLALSHDSPGLLRLLADGVLRGSNSVFVVHHDPRGPALDLPTDDRVVRVPNPTHLRWGREDLGLAILDSLEFCLDRYAELSWVLVVSGRDQLCRPMRAIESTLAESSHDAYARWFAVPRRPDTPEHPWQVQCRKRYLQRVRLPGTHHSVPFVRRNPFDDGTGLFIGDAWVNLSGRALRHVIEQRHGLGDVERFLSRCTATDEALLPTLLHNGDTGLRIADTTRRFMRWTPGAAHPAVLRPADIPAVVASDAFFARKFDDLETAMELQSAYTDMGRAT
ncbi:beta-1,6-N-acetylglucosaminyltransferase [Solicola gregarius]|uniref:Core-2/I-Branching enzyme n=1 Tax=Solicola gregarius TaxID=2908642 RepID=A0AA46TKI1_9ACTN|nr:beta-1,6-N-acetylglucosaminyltransferase [Solicola gregarius]UYM06557.1 hypothetical protein L0C25_05645 [Solicola gregarius]